MIRIKKPALAPAKLLQEGKIEAEKNKNLYEQFAEDYKKGIKKFEFKKEIYGHTSVKEALKVAQYHKCCFCERKEEIGDVEHFRPKGAFKQKEKEKLSKTGYYWLAYEWDNLLFCCPKCNRSYKKNFFPLVDPSQRAVSHKDDILKEDPFIIHPVKENPEEYIEFYREKPRAINGNVKGKTTIKRTGIDRPFLDEDRNKLYEIYKQIFELIQLPNIDLGSKASLQKMLDEAMQDSASFASMIRCAIRDKFVY